MSRYDLKPNSIHYDRPKGSWEYGGPEGGWLVISEGHYFVGTTIGDLLADIEFEMELKNK